MKPFRKFTTVAPRPHHEAEATGPRLRGLVDTK
jgi:hypothetical protein